MDFLNKSSKVNTIVTIILVIIHFLPKTGSHCDTSLQNSLVRNFYHANIPHLATNLYALKSLYNLESQSGPLNYVGIIVVITAINTIIDYFITSNMNTQCSIGFSGILLGLFSFELIGHPKKSIQQVLPAIIAMVVYPSIKNPRASLLGHTIGALSGLIFGLLIHKVH